MILVGYRATGKTTVASILSDRFLIPAIDSDKEIEREAGKSIAEIFASCGEIVFRDMEESIISRLLLRGDSMILSTGGGVILRESTREKLRLSGKVVWLQASPEIILGRMQADSKSKTTRPSLTSLPPLDEIIELLEKRKSLYEQVSTISINTDNLTPTQIADQCEKFLK
ncbi:MAG: shikimate kinase [Planctomycetaceae bacterium]|jgi:shikimate kinase|nr:shikimate kinase [Planctomycetaceae bacterium]